VGFLDFFKSNVKEQKVGSKMILNRARCGECNREMIILIGMGVPGIFNNNIMYPLMRQGKLKGSWRCHRCERYYCWDCSDSDKQCKCGDQNWVESFYFESTADLSF